MSNDDEYKRPNEGAQCVVSYTASLPDGTVFDKQSDLTITVDDGGWRTAAEAV